MTRPTELEPLLMPEEAAEILRISRCTLNRLVDAGRIEVERIPGRGRKPILRFTRRALADFLRANAAVSRPAATPEPTRADRERLIEMGWDGEEHGRKRRKT